MRKEGPGVAGRRTRTRTQAARGQEGRHQREGGKKWGGGSGREDRSFVRSTAGESGESEHEGCCHDRGGCLERAWEEHGGGDDEG